MPLPIKQRERCRIDRLTNKLQGGKKGGELNYRFYINKKNVQEWVDCCLRGG